MKKPTAKTLVNQYAVLRKLLSNRELEPKEQKRLTKLARETAILIANRLADAMGEK